MLNLRTAWAEAVAAVACLVAWFVVGRRRGKATIPPPRFGQSTPARSLNILLDQIHLWRFLRAEMLGRHCAGKRRCLTSGFLSNQAKPANAIKMVFLCGPSVCSLSDLAGPLLLI